MAKQHTQTDRAPTPKATGAGVKRTTPAYLYGFGVVGGLILLVLAFGLYQPCA
jgi:hypothetical protein